MRKQDISPKTLNWPPKNRTERLALIKSIPFERLEKTYDFLTQMKRSGIGIYPIIESEFRNLSNLDISLIYGEINRVYDNFKFDWLDDNYSGYREVKEILNSNNELEKVYSLSSDALGNNVFFMNDLVPKDTFLERSFVIGQQFNLALEEVTEVLLSKRKKTGSKNITINLNISDEISNVYKKIKVTNDVVTGGMKIIGAGNCDIFLGRKNEQTFLLVEKVLDYHNIVQDVEELYSVLERSKKSSKKLVQSKNTNASTLEKRDHIVQIVGEVNRTIKKRSGVEKLISLQTKGLSTDEIRLKFNLNLGKTSG